MREISVEEALLIAEDYCDSPILNKLALDVLASYVRKQHYDKNKTRDMLRRSRNLLSHPKNWDEETRSSREGLMVEIDEMLHK